MHTKNLLTVIHCVLAVIITPLGIAGARMQSEDHPLLAPLLSIGAIVFPVFLATRISWRAGFEAGRGAVVSTPESLLGSRPGR